MLRDRIVDFRRVPAGDLRANPKNWRTHNAAQRAALDAVLASVGIAGAVLAREMEDGGLELIDGHLRTEGDHNQLWPVLVVDVTPEEADVLLATHDPIAALAEMDIEALTALVRGVGQADFDVVKAAYEPGLLESLVAIDYAKAELNDDVHEKVTTDVRIDFTPLEFSVVKAAVEKYRASNPAARDFTFGRCISELLRGGSWLNSPAS